MSRKHFGPGTAPHMARQHAGKLQGHFAQARGAGGGLPVASAKPDAAASVIGGAPPAGAPGAASPAAPPMPMGGMGGGIGGLDQA